MKTLRLILGDQLNRSHSWFSKTDTKITYLFVEARSESEYVTHHIQKMVCFFVAMRQFAQQVESLGHRVIYIDCNHKENRGSITEQVLFEINNGEFNRFEFQEPDEYRLDEALSQLCSRLSIPTQRYSSEHFLADRFTVKSLFSEKKTYLMETFYRNQRKQFSILMNNGEPMGKKWNYDADNRKPFTNKRPVPDFHWLQQDVSSVLNDIKQAGFPHFGAIKPDSFIWPTNREQALSLLSFFCRYQLPFFGTYEDAMHTDHPVLFHSRLSQALNMKLLHPLEVIYCVLMEWKMRPAEPDLASLTIVPEEYESFYEQLSETVSDLSQLGNASEKISLNQVEGFIRQILGWREFMRGIYWAEMPEFKTLNFFNHDRKLPDWFWTGKTNMNCLKQAITQSLSMAWAHHIQRLMITGNFALLAGIHPDEVDQWYLGIYIDAIEWVEITNTRGMSQFADGGLIATKPYVSSGNYIDKMSNYCDTCYYSKNIKFGHKACPFNSLYWHFYERNESKLRNNPRIGMMYRTWEKMNPQTKESLLNQAEYYLNRLEEL